MKTQSRPARSTFACPDPLDHRWGVILAGGDGKRLLPLTRRIAGDNRPKQFCAIMDGETLLAQTRRRVVRMIEPQHTLLVVTKQHECFYANQLADTTSCTLLIQPCNQGTAPAILYSLFHLRESDPSAVVGFFPSDHHFANDEAFIAHVDSAFEAAESSGRVVLLGIAPSGPEVEYGWIEPAAPLTNHAFGTVFEVSRFWEKPQLSLASALMERGCLWNSFVMVGHVNAFLNLVRRTLPDLVELFDSIRPSLLTQMEPAALLRIYSDMSPSNFSVDVLAARPNDLAVLSGGNLGWSDLGEASRVLSILGCSGRAKWALDYAEECNTPG
jgi:mannose-1-phosphate guanylyltransferase